MVILLTGASHTGKTVLAQRLLERLHMPYLSIDHLKMGLIRSGNTALTPQDDDALTPYLWAIVREIMKTAIENRQNLIVEGCYVPFDWRKDFDAQTLPAIRFCCLAMTDAYLDAHFAEVQRHACDVEARLDDTCLSREWLKTENRRMREGFLRVGETVALIDADWTQTVEGFVNRFQAPAEETDGWNAM